MRELPWTVRKIQKCLHCAQRTNASRRAKRRIHQCAFLTLSPSWTRHVHTYYGRSTNRLFSIAILALMRISLSDPELIEQIFEFVNPSYTAAGIYQNTHCKKIQF